MNRTMLWVAMFLLGWSRTAQAVDKGFSEALGHIEIRSTGSEGEAIGWTLGALFVLLIVGPIVAYLYRQRHPVKKASAAKPTMQKQAQQLGFKLREIRVLKQLAARMQGQIDLASAEGRMRFARDIEKRMRRKRRELEVLATLRERLVVDAAYTARETARVEADLAVWLVRKAGRDEGEYADVEQAGGTLVDLGEGGAALRSDLALAAGDVVEWWSTDSQIWIPPLTAVVVRTEEGTAHVQFVAPPVGELRRIMGELAREIEAAPVE